MDVITLIDEFGTILYQSHSVEQAFGYSQQELIGSEITALVHPDDMESTAASLQSLLRREFPEIRRKLRFLHKNGEWRYIEVQARVFEDQSNLRVIITSRDITESQIVLEELRQSHELFQTAFHASANICTLTKFDSGEYIDVNLAFEKATGWPREHVISNTALKINIWGSIENRQRFRENLHAAGSVSGFSTSLRSRSGEFIDVVIDAKILMISGSKCIYISAVDITATKKLEEQLRHSQKMEAVGQLTGGIAHDFNNLLSVILGNSEIIQAALEPTSTLHASVEAILKATNRGAGLTHQLLAFSRKQTLQPRSISLNEVARYTVEMLSQSLSEDIKIQTTIDEGLWPIEVDPGQLENAILNLALNSRDAMPHGGTIEIAYSNRTIDESDSLSNELTAGDYVSLAFTDTGLGMPPNIIQQVFEPFFTTKEMGRGTGLGLSMVFGFVKQSGGHVFIQSELHEGTTVTILLPRSEAVNSVQPAGKGQAALPEWQGCTALLVEDNIEVRKLTAGMLKKIGFDVLQAEDGCAAVELLKQNSTIDFMLSDVVLPGELKGPDIAKLVQNQFPDATILLMSGFTPLDLNPADNPYTRTPVISKPFTNEELVRRIQTEFMHNK